VTLLAQVKWVGMELVEADRSKSYSGLDFIPSDIRFNCLSPDKGYLLAKAIY